MVSGIAGRNLRPGIGGGRPLSPRRQLGLDVLIGLAARMVLAATTSYRGLDADVFAGWARTMHDHPLGEFYARAPMPDHLPGDLWVLKGIEVVYSAAGGTAFGSGVFELITNAVPMLADVLVGVLLFRIVTQWRSEEEAARVARWYLLNPAVIVIAGAWGQWDSVSVAVLLGGILLVLRPGWQWVAATPVMVWASLIKPQLAVPAAIMLVWVLARPDSQFRGEARAGFARIVAAVVGSVVAGGLAAIAILQPFNVGLLWSPDGGSTLAARARYAADLHRFTTMGAANLWMLVDRKVIGPADDTARWGHLAPVEIGVVLLVILWSVVAMTAWRAFPPDQRLESLWWASAAATCASCLAPTRVHERYYFSVLVLLLVWTAIRDFDRVSVVCFWCFSVLFAVDLALPMGWTGHDDQFLHRPGTLVVISALHVLFFAVLIAIPWRERSAPRPSLRAGERAEGNAAHRTAPG